MAKKTTLQYDKEKVSMARFISMTRQVSMTILQKKNLILMYLKALYKQRYLF